MSTLLYLGPEGTHSHEAAKMFGLDGATLVPCRTFGEIFRKLAEDSSLEAIIPFENSIEGPVTQALDLLAEYDRVRIRKSLSFHIRHNLLTAGELLPHQITRVISHPQALGQCDEYLRRNLPEAELIESTSTAAAAKEVSGTTAAIASLAAAELNGLHVLQRNIQGARENITRFLIVTSAEPDASAETTRALFYITLPNEPGALLKVLQPFNTVGVNLTFIQSRPRPKHAFQYGFFMEALITPELTQLMKLLLDRFSQTRIIGSY